MDKKKFFDSLRPHVNLTTENVMGLSKMIDLGLEYKEQRNQFAYILATVWWETGQRVQPIREAFWLSESWRRKNLRYYPYYGRGLVQTTWKENYRKIGDMVGYDFVSDPDAIMDWKYAGKAVFEAMNSGAYTGKSLDNYIDDIDETDDEDLREYIAARRIINGTDKAKTIANLSLRFENALKAGGYPLKPTGKPVQSVPEKSQPDVFETPVARPEAPVKETTVSGLLVTFLKFLFGRK